MGLRLAELSISDLLPLIPMKDLVIKPGESQVIDYFYVNTDNLVSFQHQLKVKKNREAAN